MVVIKLYLNNEFSVPVVLMISFEWRDIPFLCNATLK